MAGPWDDYAAQPAAASAGPWAHYASGGAAKPSATAPAASAPPARSDGFFGNLAGGVIEPLAAMASGLVARPVSQVAGLAAAGREMFPGAPQGDPQAFQQDIQRSMTYEPKTAAGQSPMNPLNFIPQLLGQLWSPVAHGVGNFIAPPGSEPGREAVGRGVTEALEQAPGFVGLKAPGAAAATAPVVKGAARDMMQSALKPGQKAQRTGKADTAIDTLLDEGINVTRGGAEKLQGRVDDLNSRIAAVIDASPAVVDKELVVSRLQGNLQKALNEVNPQTSLATIQKAWTDFLNHPGLPGIDMPVQQAQAMKTGTNRTLREKYGEMGSTEVEAQKSLVRGLKEEIAAQVPEVRPLNAEDSKLINALSQVEKRAMMEANKNPIGLGLLSIHPSHMVAWMADRSGLFKSLIARMLNQTSESLPGMARAGPAMGLAVGQQAQQYGAPTGPPPQ